MSALNDYEDALRALISERTTGDDTPWPIVGYFTYVVTTDPETMNLEEPEWVIPDGQMNFVTRGLIEQARTEFAESTAPVFSSMVWDDDDDE